MLSCLSNPFSVTIEDLQLILGPQLPATVAQRDDFDDDEPYESENYNDIKGEEVKVPEEGKIWPRVEAEKVEKVAQAAKDPPAAVINLILKNVTLVINRIHVRYEDDYYANEKPFAFGLVCKVLLVSIIANFLLCDSE